MTNADKSMSDGGAAERDAFSRPQTHLTIVIPHFNQEQFLPRAVASVLSGETRGIEIIIVDDGSTNDAEPVLRALEATDPCVTVIRGEKNQGVTTVINIGLAAARGSYVTFLGADDFIMPDAYAALVRALDDNPRAALGCGQIALVGDDGGLRGIRPVTPPSFGAAYLDPSTICRRIEKTDHWIASASAVFRTDLLRAVGGFDVSLGVFSDVVVARILAFEHGFVYVPGIRAVFRVAASTFSGSTLLDQDENIRQLAIARERLSASIVGRVAPDYPDLFARRFRFSAARRQLLWNRPSADPDVIVKVAGGTDSDAKALTAIRENIGFGTAGRAFAVIWLTVRLRPFSLLHLIAHSLWNKVTYARNRQRITDWICRMEDAGQKIMAGVETQPSRSAQ